MRIAPKIIEVLFLLRRSQATHGIDGRAHAIDGQAPLQPGYAYGAVQDHHPLAAFHHQGGPSRLHEMDPPFKAASMAETLDIAPIIDKAVIKRMVTDKQVHRSGGGTGKRLSLIHI